MMQVLPEVLVIGQETFSQELETFLECRAHVMNVTRRANEEFTLKVNKADFILFPFRHDHESRHADIDLAKQLRGRAEDVWFFAEDREDCNVAVADGLTMANAKFFKIGENRTWRINLVDGLHAWKPDAAKDSDNVLAVARSTVTSPGSKQLDPAAILKVVLQALVGVGVTGLVAKYQYFFDLLAAILGSGSP